MCVSGSFKHAQAICMNTNYGRIVLMKLGEMKKKQWKCHISFFFLLILFRLTDARVCVCFHYFFKFSFYFKWFQQIMLNICFSISFSCNMFTSYWNIEDILKPKTQNYCSIIHTERKICWYWYLNLKVNICVTKCFSVFKVIVW